ncbi:MAG: tRNA (adenosine(37)-N6)-threonylcarbamoyltransferase complex ATPase subunit type 1 TsaE [Ruminococcus sp.]|nr:tRNA (adenosine(37)-N6)-threonylcarbamoyltransferase complex ATPase subunit type 1 TsaE [Ruminococcus sp.]
MISHSTDETENEAVCFAGELEKGDIIAFFGGLGAGKTAFIRGLAKGLGSSGFVTSPTFTICNEYDGSPSLIHFDMYRIKTEADLESIGFYDYLEKNAIIAIEWFENISGYNITPTVTVDIETIDENTRKINIKKT